MRFETTRATRPGRFIHRAGFYSSREDLVRTVVPMARESLAGGRPVALIATEATAQLLRAALDEPDGLIHLPEPRGWLRESGQAVITQRARELRELTDWAGAVTVLTEHHPDRPGIRPVSWVEADAAANIALTDLPITMTCLYPAETEREAVGDGVRWNHPELVGTDGTARPNPGALAPAQVLARYPTVGLASLGPPDQELRFTAWQLVTLRAAVSAASEHAGLSPDRTQDFVLAVNEVASNAAEHGHGSRTMRMWRRPGRLVCEVHDDGALTDPLPGLRAPHPNDPRGRGLWIARQLCDLLHVWSDGQGTHVRLQAARVA